MGFEPPFCPRNDCKAHSKPPFRWTRKGFYHRRCDGRRVQRFECLECSRGFSAQCFRVDYRLQRPELSVRLVWAFVSKTTHRQSARIHGCDRKTVLRRLKLLADHCRAFHQERLAESTLSGGLAGVFQLDELETFERNRRLCPVTVPVIIERKSLFVLHATTAALPARGNLSERDEKAKLALEKVEGKRVSGSVEAVRECLEVMRAVHCETPAFLQTDKKTSYERLFRELFPGKRNTHSRHDSKAVRNRKNPLFPINHTLAMLRDGVSRLVRRSWGVSKKRDRLRLHVWIWIAYRNYVRGITNKAPDVTPAMAIGLVEKQWGWAELLARRVFAG